MPVVESLATRSAQPEGEGSVERCYARPGPCIPEGTFIGENHFRGPRTGKRVPLLAVVHGVSGKKASDNREQGGRREPAQPCLALWLAKTDGCRLQRQASGTRATPSSRHTLH